MTEKKTLPKRWWANCDWMLGKVPDIVLARSVDVSQQAVMQKRRALGIDPADPIREKIEVTIGVTDPKVARRVLRIDRDEYRKMEKSVQKADLLRAEIVAARGYLGRKGEKRGPRTDTKAGKIKKVGKLKRVRL